MPTFLHVALGVLLGLLSLPFIPILFLVVCVVILTTLEFVLRFVDLAFEGITSLYNFIKPYEEE